MKSASLAPVYACLYPGLCDVARARGYALSIHGSVTQDLDLVAIPWTEQAGSAEDLIKALLAHTGACLYPELLQQQGHPQKFIDQVMASNASKTPEKKPHGRLAWNLHYEQGAKIDVSVMPRSPA